MTQVFRMQELEAWLTLNHVNQLGPATFQKLLNHFNTPEAVLCASQNELHAIGINKNVIHGIQNPKAEVIQQDLAWLEHESHHLISINDDALS